jgi:hypothetical protein
MIRRAALNALTGVPASETVDPMHHRAAAALLATAASAGVAAPAQANGRPWVPAPPKFSVVYDGAAGYDPGSTDAQAVGQYADTNTNTVHTTRGNTKRAIAQDVGQLFANNVLDSGQQAFFTKLLLGANHPWANMHGAQPEGQAAATGDEAFSDYYALEATGGLAPNESMAWGDVPIDHRKLKLFGAAIRRLAQRQHLTRYRP